MITAYFDDSGTHTGGRSGPSRVVVVAGIVGTEGRLTGLESAWRRLLASPVDGRKDALRRFHMFDCNESDGEFRGWSRTETDYFCQQLRETIIESGVAGYGIAVVRQDWDDIIKGDLRKFLGDAEGYCISQCFVRAVGWARDNTFDPEITFVFDNRTPEIERRAKTLGHAFALHSQQPRVVGTEFSDSRRAVLLQAADLLAWEIYQHAGEILDAGGSIVPSSRRSMHHLARGMHLNTQIAQRSSIEQIADYIRSNAEHLEDAANHFTTFDPERPDYSHLKGRQG